MRIGPCTLLLAFSFAPVLLLHTASAQTAAPAATVPSSCYNSTVPTEQHHYVPYTAKLKTTHVRTLANGTIVTTIVQAQEWRDADGRARTETLNTMPDGTQVQANFINDPVLCITMSWAAGNPSGIKSVLVLHYSQPVAQPAPTTPQAVQRTNPIRSESLPPKTIEGLYATGTRYTRSIPAGAEGNDQDITITTEYWKAPSLNIQLHTLIDDPRKGKTTTNTTDIQLVDPDPALFQPPSGYELKEANQVTPPPQAVK
ncbi:MAG: hypothetical protein ACLQM6_11065 [Acidobacteriaceae bacterium]